VDDDYNLTQDYFHALKNSTMQMPEEFKDYQQPTIDLVSNIYSENNNNMLENERNKPIEAKVNDNFYKKEFQKLWNKINVKTAYTVKFETKDLINNCITALDNSLTVSEIIYQIKDGIVEIKTKEEVEKGGGLQLRETSAGKVTAVIISGIKYDVVKSYEDLLSIVK
jgi:type III restriction enzyme